MKPGKQLTVLANAVVQPCPLCGGGEFALLKANDRYLMGVRTVGCRSCGLLQTNPRPSGEALAAFYAHDYRRYYQDITSPSDEYVRGHNKDLRMRYTVGFVLRATAHRRPLRVLDVGCSEGSFFAALRAAGYEGYLEGVEPNPDFASFATRKTGAHVVANLAEAGVNHDLVTLSHVFEHFLNPGHFLEEVKKHLAGNGLLYIDVPDADAYDSLADLHIAHVFHFTARTLQALLQAHGFVLLTSERHAPPHHPKSVRVVATLAQPRTPVHGISTDTHSESQAWQRVTAIRVAPYLLRQAAGRTWLGRYLSRALKRWRGGQAG